MKRQTLNADGDLDGGAVAARAAALFGDSYHQLAIQSDRLFGRLLVLEWLAGIVLALRISPLTYSGTQSTIHIHVYAAGILGLVIIAFPLLMIRLAPGAVLTRHAIAAGQMTLSGLLIAVTGGRIETHFLIFGSLAFLAFYRDWKILVTASAITVADHLLRGVFLPVSIYGTTLVSEWRWLEHTIYIVFEDVFLISSCQFGMRERQSVSMRQAESELAGEKLLLARNELEFKVQSRAAELSEANASLAAEVAEHVLTEKSLRRARSLLSNVLESSLDAVMAFESVRDNAGRIVNFRCLLANPAVEAIVGKPEPELVGRLLLDLFPQNAATGMFDAYVKVVETGCPLNLEQFNEEAGRRVWLKVSAVRLGDGFSVTYADITERIKNELSLKDRESEGRRMKEAAESATRAKSEFLANMSHELRTPLTAIVGFADIMLDADQSASDRLHGLRIIRRSARQLMDLINDILDLSKIEAGRMSVENIVVELPPILSEVVAIMRPRAIQKGIELRCSFEGSVPRRVYSDPVRLKQILINLVSNAVKFTEQGRVKICVGWNAARQTLSFAVNDTGIGISSDRVDQLFKSFVQADGSTTRRFGGTGLGLSISRHLAQLLGGDITATSVPGTGSTFIAQVSGVPDPSHEFCREGDVQLVADRDSTPKYSAVRGRVLLAEDGRDNRLLISTMLRKAGWEVEVADNGRIAVEMASSGGFDLVLMDMQMPELDGYAATSLLREQGFCKPIIALTAHAMSGDRDKCLKSGCTGYLAKPIDRALLLETVNNHLEQWRMIAPGSVECGAASSSSRNDPIISTLADDALIGEILPIFVDNLPVQVALIVKSLAKQDMTRLRMVLHQLKGAGGSYGFETLTHAAASAEASIAANAPLDTIKTQVDALVDLVRSVPRYDTAKELAGN